MANKEQKTPGKSQDKKKEVVTPEPPQRMDPRKKPEEQKDSKNTKSK